MKRFRTAAVLAAFLVLLFPAAARAILVIDVNATGGKRMPIAIPDFVVVGGDASMAKAFPKVISGDLGMTSLFDVIGPEAYLEKVVASHFKPKGTQLAFPSWKLIGAEAVVIGKVEKRGDSVSIDMRLYDATLGTMMIGKKYAGPAKRYRIMLHRFANEIMFAFTGVRGIFDTDIAFSAHPRTGNAQGKGKEIYLIGVDGEDLRQVTGNRSFNLFPRWSPDGQQIAFTSFRTGVQNIYLRNLQTGKEQVVVKYGNSKSPGCFSPDGRHLYFFASTSGDSDIYNIPLGGGQMNKVVGGGGLEISPSLSPDGKYMAFVSDRGGQGSPQVYVKELPDGSETRISHAGSYSTSPSWSPTGDLIAFTSQVNGRYALYVVKPDGSDLRQLVAGSGDCLDPSFSPDGRYVVYTFQKKDYSELKIVSADGRWERRLFSGLPGVGSPSWSPRR